MTPNAFNKNVKFLIQLFNCKMFRFLSTHFHPGYQSYPQKSIHWDKTGLF